MLCVCPHLAYTTSQRHELSVRPYPDFRPEIVAVHHESTLTTWAFFLLLIPQGHHLVLCNNLLWAWALGMLPQLPCPCSWERFLDLKAESSGVWVLLFSTTSSGLGSSENTFSFGYKHYVVLFLFGGQRAEFNRSASSTGKSSRIPGPENPNTQPYCSNKNLQQRAVSHTWQGVLGPWAYLIEKPTEK